MASENLPKCMFLHEGSQQITDKRIKNQQIVIQAQDTNKVEKIIIQKIHNKLQLNCQSIQKHIKTSPYIHNLQYSSKYGLLFIPEDTAININPLNNYQQELKTGKTNSKAYTKIPHHGQLFLSPSQSQLVILNDKKIIIYLISQNKIILQINNQDKKIQNIQWFNEDQLYGWKFFKSAYKINIKDQKCQPIQGVNQCTSINKSGSFILISEGGILKIFQKNKFVKELNVTEIQNDDFSMMQFNKIFSIVKLNNLESQVFLQNDVYMILFVFYQDKQDYSQPCSRTISFMRGNLKQEGIAIRGNQLIDTSKDEKKYYLSQEYQEFGFQMKSIFYGDFVAFSIQHTQTIYAVYLGEQFQSMEIFSFNPFHNLKSNNFFKGVALFKNEVGFEMESAIKEKDVDTKNLLSLYFSEKEMSCFISFPMSILVIDEEHLFRRYAVSTKNLIEEDDNQFKEKAQKLIKDKLLCKPINLSLKNENLQKQQKKPQQKLNEQKKQKQRQDLKKINQISSQISMQQKKQQKKQNKKENNKNQKPDNKLNIDPSNTKQFNVFKTNSNNFSLPHNPFGSTNLFNTNNNNSNKTGLFGDSLFSKKSNNQTQNKGGLFGTNSVSKNQIKEKLPQQKLIEVSQTNKKQNNANNTKNEDFFANSAIFNNKESFANQKKTNEIKKQQSKSSNISFSSQNKNLFSFNSSEVKQQKPKFDKQSKQPMKNNLQQSNQNKKSPFQFSFNSNSVFQNKKNLFFSQKQEQNKFSEIKNQGFNIFDKKESSSLLQKQKQIVPIKFEPKVNKQQKKEQKLQQKKQVNVPIINEGSQKKIQFKSDQCKKIDELFKQIRFKINMYQKESKLDYWFSLKNVDKLLENQVQQLQDDLFNPKVTSLIKNKIMFFAKTIEKTSQQHQMRKLMLRDNFYKTEMINNFKNDLDNLNNTLQKLIYYKRLLMSNNSSQNVNIFSFMKNDPQKQCTKVLQKCHRKLDQYYNRAVKIQSMLTAQRQSKFTTKDQLNQKAYQDQDQYTEQNNFDDRCSVQEYDNQVNNFQQVKKHIGYRFDANSSESSSSQQQIMNKYQLQRKDQVNNKHPIKVYSKKDFNTLLKRFIPKNIYANTQKPKFTISEKDQEIKQISIIQSKYKINYLQQNQIIENPIRSSFVNKIPRKYKQGASNKVQIPKFQQHKKNIIYPTVSQQVSQVSQIQGEEQPMPLARNNSSVQSKIFNFKNNQNEKQKQKNSMLSSVTTKVDDSKLLKDSSNKEAENLFKATVMQSKKNDSNNSKQDILSKEKSKNVKKQINLLKNQQQKSSNFNTTPSTSLFSFSTEKPAQIKDVFTKKESNKKEQIKKQQKKDKSNQLKAPDESSIKKIISRDVSGNQTKTGLFGNIPKQNNKTDPIMSGLFGNNLNMKISEQSKQSSQDGLNKKFSKGLSISESKQNNDQQNLKLPTNLIQQPKKQSPTVDLSESQMIFISNEDSKETKNTGFLFNINKSDAKQAQNTNKNEQKLIQKKTETLLSNTQQKTTPSIFNFGNQSASNNNSSGWNLNNNNNSNTNNNNSTGTFGFSTASNISFGGNNKFMNSGQQNRSSSQAFNPNSINFSSGNSFSAFNNQNNQNNSFNLTQNNTNSNNNLFNQNSENSGNNSNNNIFGNNQPNNQSQEKSNPFAAYGNNTGGGWLQFNQNNSFNQSGGLFNSTFSGGSSGGGIFGQGNSFNLTPSQNISGNMMKMRTLED